MADSPQDILLALGGSVPLGEAIRQLQEATTPPGLRGRVVTAGVPLVSPAGAGGIAEGVAEGFAGAAKSALPIFAGATAATVGGFLLVKGVLEPASTTFTKTADELANVGQKLATIPEVAGLTPGNPYSDYVFTRDIVRESQNLATQRSQSDLFSNLGAAASLFAQQRGYAPTDSVGSAYPSPGAAYRQPSGGTFVVQPPSNQNQQGFNWLPLLAIGGLAVVALFALKGKK